MSQAVLEREGDGWRLAWDPQRQPFPVLIGGEGWASELTSAEGHTLQRAFETLLSQHSALSNTLMEEETICLEFQSSIGSCHASASATPEGTLWVALEGDRRHWGVRFVLEPAAGVRGVEGSWPPAGAADFAQAFSGLDFSGP